MARPSPGRSPWRGLLVVAGLLACGSSQASSQLSISPGSLLGLLGEETSLMLENAPEDALEYSWHRGPDDKAENMIISYSPASASWKTGPKYTDRENVTRIGSLVIRKTALNDTGDYTVSVKASNDTQKATGWLEVRELEPDPVLSVNTSSVAEDKDSIEATCHTNVTGVKWFLNAAPVSSSDQLTISPDGKILILKRVGRHDVTLRCAIESFLGVPLQSETVFFNVAYGPDSMQLRSKPTAFREVLSAEVGSRVEMTCDALSKPGVRYRWLHNGSFLSSEAQLTFASLAWEHMGSYRCIVDNPAAQLTMYKDVSIQVPEVFPDPLKSSFSISGSIVVVLIVLTVLGSVYLCGMVIYVLINHRSNRTNRGRSMSL
ncbi:cell adhesion molecule CEACAM18 [Dasypus novemcinctus]|uniref:cell adhesion molecule CEACAM18 n=1 Tax=Dasypus novemcinctus TaxID=9361 RepID=UPI00265EB20D|nr:carcinoembryonic antigen-related cell adhesion molecule 18 [Dasypus novemcinctus]